MQWARRDLQSKAFRKCINPSGCTRSRGLPPRPSQHRFFRGVGKRAPSRGQTTARSSQSCAEGPQPGHEQAAGPSGCRFAEASRFKGESPPEVCGSSQHAPGDPAGSAWRRGKSFRPCPMTASTLFCEQKSSRMSRIRKGSFPAANDQQTILPRAGWSCPGRRRERIECGRRGGQGHPTELDVTAGQARRINRPAMAFLLGDDKISSPPLEMTSLKAIEVPLKLDQITIELY